MRALALLLIVANLGYLAWALLIDTPSDLPPAAASLDTSPRLVLASERVPEPIPANKKPATRVAAKPATPATESLQDATGKKCVSVGPFQDLPTVVEASAILKGAGFDSHQRLEQGELWVGHWVSIAGFATHEQAQNAVDRLKSKGVDDAYILPGADPPNVISLGVFKEHDRAQRRLNEARSIGFDATIADRTRAGSVYWVDVDLKDSKQTVDTSILSSQPGKIIRLELRSCAQSGTG
jgi:cell division septation protein DedD